MDSNNLKISLKLIINRKQKLFLGSYMPFQVSSGESPCINFSYKKEPINTRITWFYG